MPTIPGWPPTQNTNAPRPTGINPQAFPGQNNARSNSPIQPVQTQAQPKTLGQPAALTPVQRLQQAANTGATSDRTATQTMTQNRLPEAAPTYGSHSGPGILEQWFNQRASGTDPAYEYTMGRGMDAIDNRMAAAGSFNSGARGQQLSDFAANAGAQRMSALDALAGGASGEHMGRLNSMFAQGMGLAGGQAGVAGQYDTGAANAMNSANQAILMMMLNKAGVDSQATQGFLNNLFSGLGLAVGGGGGRPA